VDFKKIRHGTSIVATRCQLRLIRRTLSVINWTVVGRTRLTILAKVDVRPTTVDSLSHQASTPLSTAQLASGSKSRPCATAYTCFHVLQPRIPYHNVPGLKSIILPYTHLPKIYKALEWRGETQRVASDRRRWWNLAAQSSEKSVTT